MTTHALGKRAALMACKQSYTFYQLCAQGEPAIMSKKKGQTRVYIYPEWCKGCGVCAAFCPGKVMEMNHQGKAEVVREDDCVNCGFCELHCPDFAISVVMKNGTKPIPGTDFCPGVHSPLPHQPEDGKSGCTPSSQAAAGKADEGKSASHLDGENAGKGAA